MSIIYINRFRNAVQQKAGGNSTIVALKPDYDPGIVALSPHPSPAFVDLGPMRVGTSVPTAAVGALTYQNPSFTYAPPLQLDPGGLVVEVDNNVSATPTTPQGTAVYLVLPDLVIEGDGTLTAQVAFDLPNAVGGGGTDVWAVGLNFKYGDQNDAGPAVDHNFGPTCQFSAGGTVKFNKTDYGGLPDTAKMYADFALYPAVEFVLTMDLVVATGVVKSSTATLSYGSGIPPTGNVKLPADLNLALVTAVGVSVVSTKNTFTKFGVRLRSFTFSATPLVFGVH